VTMWQKALLAIPVLLMSACAAPARMELTKSFVDIAAGNPVMAKVLQFDPNTNALICRAGTLPYHFDDVWVAVHQALSIQGDPIDLDYEGTGNIRTKITSHGSFGSYDCYYEINIEESEPGKTTIKYGYFRWHYVWAGLDAVLETKSEPEQDRDVMESACQSFEAEIVKALPSE